MAERASPPVPSPCISVCALGEGDLCIGCHRSAEEISAWALASDAERRKVLALAAQRAARNNPFASRLASGQAISTSSTNLVPQKASISAQKPPSAQ